MSEDQTVSIDGVEYNLNSLSDNAKAQLQSLQQVDQKLAQNEQERAILQTARNAYANELKQELPVVSNKPVQ